MAANLTRIWHGLGRISRLVSAVGGLWLASFVPLWAEVAAPRGGQQPSEADLVDALGMTEMFDVLAEEGRRHAQALDDALLAGEGGRSWVRDIGGLYAPGALLARFEVALGARFAAAPEALDVAAAFFSSDLGARVVTREVEARRALVDPRAREAAEVAVDRAREARVPRLRQIERVIAAAGFVERNVAAGLAGQLAFEEGRAAALALSARPSAAAVRAQVAQLEPQIRAEAELWLSAFFFEAYGALSDAEVQAVLAFWQSDAGKVTLEAIFAGYSAALDPVMRDMGQAAGRVLASHAI